MQKLIYSLAILFVLAANAADTSSNITIQNTTGSALTIKGIYIQKFASGSACNNISFGSFPSAKRSYGTIWKAQTLAAGATKSIGASYLYQMLSQITYVYSINSAGGSFCTPGIGRCDIGENPNTNQWCINLGFSKGSPLGTGESIDNADDLLPLASSLEIKITCNDATSTCVADTPTTQSF